jgi:AcrR family transcriptional regulator
MTQSDSSSSRVRRPRNSLTVDSIVDAAENVAASGLEGLTIRAVATELDASPMALYRYVATKEELVDALLNRVLGRFERPAETDDWVHDLVTFARAHYDLLVRHAWAIAPLISHPDPGPNALPIGEAALRVLRRGGITGDSAVASFSAVVALNYGWASFAVARNDALPPEPRNAAELESIRTDFPLTAEVVEAFSRYGSPEHYERALDHVVTGIAAASGTARSGASEAGATAQP